MVTRISSILFAFALLFMTASTSFAAQTNEDVTNSKHNLGVGSGVAAWNNAVGDGSATNEVCVFCHTPHGSNMAADMEAAPLWNRAIGEAVDYMTHAGNLAMTEANDEFTEVGQGTIACLSCHDGTRAIDVMFNLPGSGGGSMTGTASGYTFGYKGGAGFTTIANTANLGTNLMNDHPVSIMFNEGACDDATAGCAANTGQGFRAAVKVDDKNGWYVLDADANTTEIKIYEKPLSEFDGTSAGVVGSVECASCHNPHLPTTSSPDSLFLRVGDNANSQTCLVCHVK